MFNPPIPHNGLGWMKDPVTQKTFSWFHVVQITIEKVCQKLFAMWAQVCSKHNGIQNNEKNCAVQHQEFNAFKRWFNMCMNMMKTMATSKLKNTYNVK